MSTVTVTPTVEPSTGAIGDPPRVRLDVVDADAPAVESVTVTRLDPDGRIVPVRTFDGNPLDLTGGPGLIYDYEAPFGAPVRYSSQESPATVSAEVTVDEQRVWLIHPGVPALSMPVNVAEFGKRSRPVARGVHRPMSRRYPVVQTDGRRKAAEAVLELNTFTLSERAAFETLTDDAATLLLNVPAGFGWGVGAEYVDLGDLDEERLIIWAGQPRRLQTLPYLVVDRPVGGSQAERTLADLAEFASLADLALAYESLLDLAAGP